MSRNDSQLGDFEGFGDNPDEVQTRLKNAGRTATEPSDDDTDDDGDGDGDGDDGP